jgi:DHA1 family bicyclomycin/chloramphenicol resistance-like MFS transporter
MTKNLPFLLILSLLACCIEVDISVPSFPDIAKYFSVSDGLIQMTIAINFFGFFISSLFYGPLSESYGRRKLMIIGNVFLLIGAIGCVFANSIELLLFARFIQGIGASAAAVIVFAMIADVYSGNKAAKLVGIMNSVLTIFMSIAPIMGSFINQIIGWRGNYFVVAFVSALSLIALSMQLPETKKDQAPLDAKKVFADYRILLAHKIFVYASIAPTIGYSGYMSFIACAPFLYMETYDLSIMEYAFHQGSIVAAFSIISMFSGAMSQKFGERNSIICSLIVSMIGGIMMIFVALTEEISPFLTTISMILFSGGAAVFYPIIFTKSMEIFPNLKGASSSAIMAIRMVFCSGFVAVTSYFYNATLLPVALVVLFSAILVVIFTYRLLNFISFAKT